MDTTPEQKPEQKAEQPKGPSFLKDLVRYAIVALVVVLPIRAWVAQPFVVNGSSMDDTFKDGQYLIVDEISYRFHEPQRGDVLIFRYPQDTSKYFIKRLIGLPGETVIVKDGKVSIKNAAHPQGELLTEPYIASTTFGSLSVTLEPDEYFVMGDNRLVSSDSRVWGPLPKSDLIGRPVFRLLPLPTLSTFPGEVSSSTILK